MLVLVPPAVAGASLRSECRPGIQDASRRQRMLWYEPDLISEERAFSRAVETDTLRFFHRSPATAQETADMKWFYENRLVGSVPGEAFTEQLYASSPEQCPFCQLGVPTTLEHMFPKANFPWLAVEPRNLAPACKDCNLDRRSGTGHSSPNVYLDTWLTASTWLVATRDDSADPSALKFEVDPACGLYPHQISLLQTHLEERKLENRFPIRAKQAFRDLVSDIREERRIAEIPANDLVSEVEVTLRSRVRARASDHGTNYWEAVALRAWLTDVASIDWLTLTEPR